LWLSRALVAVLGLASAPAIAEDAALGFERTPPRLSFTDGEVSYWRPGDSDWTDARVNTALADGDELSTGPGANLELQVGSRAWVRSGEASLLALNLTRLDIGGGHDLAAPAEPHAFHFIHRRRERDFEATGALAGVRTGNRHPVRHEDQPRQYRSSQLRDSRMAVRISTAIE